jgi:radical SAM superfamily enzyme YgiQ (UPF0313 family)
VFEAGAIALVSCYELGHVPHGIAMPMAFLRRAGFAPVAVDLAVEALDDAVLDAASMVAVSVPMHTALRVGARVIERARARNPSSTIVAYGLYAPLNSDYLTSLGADHVLAGECEEQLVAIARGETSTDGHPVLAKLAFPRPARDDLRLDRYARLETATGERVLAGYTEASRGCLDTCRHCPIPSVYGGRFFVVDRDVVIDDVAAQVEAGARHITFGDPDFLNGPGHSMRVARALHERWPDITFDVTAQITHLLRHPDLVRELGQLGCAFIVSAVESLSDRVLSALRKQHRRSDVEAALALCRSAGVALRPTFVTFTPWTSLEDLRELIDFIVDAELIDHVDPIQLSVRLLVPPGSLLLEPPELRVAFGALDAAALTYRWTHRDAAVDALQSRISEIIEAATAANADDRDTFDVIRTAVYAAAELPRPSALEPRPRKRVPRLTEPWFC